VPSGPALLATLLGAAGMAGIVGGFLLGVAAGPRPARWERGMTARGLLRRVRIKAEGPDTGVQWLAVVMIWAGTAALVAAAALVKYFDLTVWRP